MKTTQWVSTKLGKVLTLQRGYDLPEQDRREGSVPIVTSSGITGYHDEARANGPGVVTGRYGTLGQVFFIKEDFWPHNTTLFVRDFKGNEPLFIKYFLSTLQLDVRSAAAAVPGLNRNALHLLRVQVPPLPTQRKIAAILSAYDDLIENNARRIKILEEMARLIYREWFVNFRFLGHEKVKMVNSRLGRVPEGWEVKEIGDVAREVRRSVSPSEVEPNTPYFGLEHLPRKSIALSEWSTIDQVQSTKLAFKKGEILFGKIRPYFHKVGVAPVDGVCSSDTIVIAPTTPEYFGIVLACVSSEEFVAHATQTSQGTKMPRANWAVLTKYPIAIPPSHMLSLFDKFMQNTVCQIQILIFKNTNLRRTRDMLLPKLISGEVDVEDLDINTSGLPV